MDKILNNLLRAQPLEDEDAMGIFDEADDDIPEVPARRLMLAISRGYQPVAVSRLDEHRFSVVMTVNELIEVVPDPLLCESKAERMRHPRIAEAAKLRDTVNRPMRGRRRTNATKDYPKYLKAVAAGERFGFWPTLTLWSPHVLAIVRVDGQVLALLPPSPLCAVDGESQVTAHYRNVEGTPDYGSENVSAVVLHGVTADEARQVFSDCASKGVKIHGSEALMRDSYCFATKVALHLAESNDLLTGKVSLRDRQLGKTNPNLVTLLLLRSSFLAFVFGVAGINFGAKQVDQARIIKAKLNDPSVLDQAVSDFEEWLEALHRHFGDDFLDRIGHMFLRGPVLAAVCALGGRDFRKGRPLNPVPLIQIIDDVDFSVGEHWAGVAGKMGARGFSVGSVREIGHAAHRALTDWRSALYAQIRS
jgi:hypothetical protein